MDRIQEMGRALMPEDRQQSSSNSATDEFRIGFSRKSFQNVITLSKLDIKLGNATSYLVYHRCQISASERSRRFSKNQAAVFVIPSGNLQVDWKPKVF